MRPFRAVGLRLVEVPAPQSEERDLDDLTTRPLREAGTLPADAVSVAPPPDFWTPLPEPKPGRLVAGTLPPEHRARFLLRLPRAWNGALVVSASPGLTSEHGCDLYWSDFLIKEGYAFGCMDKGLRAAFDGDVFYIPIDEHNRTRHWLKRFQEFTAFAQEKASRHYGRPPERAFAVGISNGGYLVRRLLEESPELVQGGVDVSGVLWRPESSLLTQLPGALAAGAGPAALQALGFPADPAWDGLTAMYRETYWGPTLALFLADLDPAYTAPLKDYDLARRPAEVRCALAEIANTGRIGAPLVSLAGRRDLLINSARHAEAYRDLVSSQGRGGRHRLILVDDATHVDADRQFFPAAQPLMPHSHKAFRGLAG